MQKQQIYGPHYGPDFGMMQPTRSRKTQWDLWIKGLNKKLDRCSISVRTGKDAIYLVATLPED